MLTTRLTASRDKHQADLEALRAEHDSATKSHSGVEATLAAVQAELVSKVADHESAVAKLSDEKSFLQAKFDKLSTLKNKLEEEIAEGAEEAEKSMRGMGDLEGKVNELQEEVAELHAELEAERKARKDDSAGWEKSRIALQSEVDAHVEKGSVHADVLAKATATADGHAEELKVCHQATTRS